MKVEIGKPLSPQLRQFLRIYLPESDMKDLAQETGKSWFTLRSMKRIGNPVPVTEFTEPAVIPMLRKAIENKMTWEFGVKAKITSLVTKANDWRATIRNRDKLETSARSAILWAQNKLK